MDGQHRVADPVTLSATETSPPAEALTPHAVRSELERITASSGFVAAPQQSRFLRYVVEEALAGRGDELSQYRVAVHALGQTAEFDPVVDATVRTYANRLRRALDSYYADPGRNDPVRITIPRGSYAPAFEVRPSAPEVATAPDERSGQGRTRPNHGSPLSPTIAVLPFQSLSPEGDYQYLAVGLTEELVFALTRYSEFVAIGPLSREQLAREGLAPHEIGAHYGARFLLDGSVGYDAGRLRVQVRLTDTTSGVNVWAETYERQFDAAAVPEVLHGIGHSVLGATVDVHGTASRLLSRELAEVAPLDIVGQQAMLMFHAYLRSMTPDSHELTKTVLERARANDPTAAPVLAALAGMYVTDHTHYGAGDEALQRGLALTEAAFRQDPHDHFVQFEGAYVYFYTKDVDEFVRVAELSVASNPRTSNHGDNALFFALAGRTERAMELFEIGRRANPHHPPQFHLAPFFTHGYNGDFEAALAAANRIHMPGYFLGPLVRAAMLGHCGRPAEAQPYLRELLELRPRFRREAHDTLERLFRYQPPVELVLEGLEQVGLEV